MIWLYILLGLVGLFILSCLYQTLIYPGLEGAILDIVSREEDISDRHLRATLYREYGYRPSLARFYQVMAELENAGYVEGRYKLSEKFPGLKERWYKIAPGGRRKRDERLLRKYWRGFKSLLPHPAPA